MEQTAHAAPSAADALLADGAAALLGALQLAPADLWLDSSSPDLLLTLGILSRGPEARL